jgi:hypothetical protein
MLRRYCDERIATLEFERANPSIVKSIRQRDLLNTWLRPYARGQSLPRLDEYRPERLGVPKLSTIIDRDLYHRAPGRIPVADILEFG